MLGRVRLGRGPRERGSREGVRDGLGRKGVGERVREGVGEKAVGEKGSGRRGSGVGEKRLRRRG